MKKLSELEEHKKKAALGGGEDKIKKQHEAGKFTAHERLDLLLDRDSFVELGVFNTGRIRDFGLEEYLGDGVVCGYGTIDGRLVYVAAEDFTVMGGSLGEIHARKIADMLELAIKNGVPFLQLNDCGGARIQEGVLSLNGYGRIFKRNTLASGYIPQISVIMGPCAGGAVYSPAITDFVFMVSHTSRMFITGPEVIKTVTGEEVSSEQLGGAVTHNTLSGNAHFMAETEEECLLLVRRLLSYLPQNNEELPPKNKNDIMTMDEDILSCIPEDSNKPFDVKEIISKIFDSDSFLEVHAHYAQNIVVGFARLRGRVVGIIANQPLILAGCLDINSADKAARFIRFCDCFNIPLVNLVDVPGFLPGTGQEYAGIIRHGAKMLFAFSEATVPKVVLVMRKAYGGAYIALCSKDMGFDIVLAWPVAEIAVMGPEGAANIVFKREIAESANPAETRKQFIREFREKFANPYVVAKSGLVDAVIDPKDTRRELSCALEAMVRKREDRPKKKHGNIPL
jgi:acetyl-CoA carboxylase carboxyltransferase component